MNPLGIGVRRASREAAPISADTRPLLADGVAFDRTAEASVWIASIHGVPSSRVSPAVVELLTAMDGRTALGDLHRRFAATESEESFLGLVGRFRGSGLLDGSTRRQPGRLTYRPPFTVQIATRRAPALFDGLDRLIVTVGWRTLVVSVAVLLGAGAVAAVLQARELGAVLTRPVPLHGLLALVVALPLVTLLHEGAHGLTLTRFGGRPRRAGFMLFYLTPAFFVDVTDGWRLPARLQRVAIALAGPAVHAVVAATALLAALVVPQPDVGRTLQLLAVSCAVIAVVNLIPFVRFDGYIALMSALDEPNLRARAMRDGAELLARALFGGRRAPRSLRRWWSAPFGIASILAPIALVVFAVSRTAQALAGGGGVAGLIVVALEAVVVLVGVMMLMRTLLRVLRSGVSRVRVVAVSGVLGVLVTIAGAMIPVPMTVSLGFVSDGDGVLLVRAADGSDLPLPDGSPATLTTRGILANRPLAAGEVRLRPPAPTTVPLDALLPVTAEGTVVSAVIVAGVDVAGARRDLPHTGQARVEVGVENLWQALWRRGVVSPLAPLLGVEKEG